MGWTGAEFWLREQSKKEDAYFDVDGFSGTTPFSSTPSYKFISGEDRGLEKHTSSYGNFMRTLVEYEGTLPGTPSQPFKINMRSKPKNRVHSYR